MLLEAARLEGDVADAEGHGFLEGKHHRGARIALASACRRCCWAFPATTPLQLREANRVFFRQTVLPLAQRVGCSIAQWLSPQFGEASASPSTPTAIDALARRPRRIVGRGQQRGVPDAERKARGGGIWAWWRAGTGGGDAVSRARWQRHKRV